MKLKDLRKLAKTIRNVNIALVLLGIGMVVAMCVWCTLFQIDAISTIQWVVLELTTMAALAVNVFLLNFFYDINSEVHTRLVKAIHKWRRKVQAKQATTNTAQPVIQASTCDETATETPMRELQVVGG